MRTQARPIDEIAATSLWAVLLRSWLRVLIVSGVVGALVFAALSTVQPQYAAVIETRIAGTAEGDASSRAMAVAETLRSRAVAEKLVADLGLAKEPAFNSTLAPDDIAGRLMRMIGVGKPRPDETAEQAVLAAYQRALRIGPGRHAEGVAIEFTSPSPELSIRAVRRLAELHQASLAGEGKTPAVTTAIDPASDREIETLAREVAAADAAVARFRNQTSPARSMEAAEAQAADLAEAVVLARRERDEAEARARSVRALLDKGRVEAVPEVQPSPALHQMIAERVRVEVQKTAAERTLPAGHPRIGEMQTRLSELRWQMFREATSILDGLENAADAAAMREGQARARLESVRADPPVSAADTDKLVELERIAAAKHDALEAARARHAAAREPTGARAGPVKADILSPPQASALPVSPRKGQVALLAAVSTLMIGFVLVIIRELVIGARPMPLGSEFADLAAAARDRASVRVEMPRLDGSVGDIAGRDASAPATTAPSADTGHFTILSSPGDAARHIAAVAATRRGHRTLLVGDGIDGALEAGEIVGALAASGRRCVLVDWSREGKGVARALGVAAAPGLNDLLGGRANFDDVILRLPGSEAHIVACGGPVADGVALDPDWISLVLDALDEAYDHIVVVARLEAARALFEAIEGRFDAGVVMSDRRAQGQSINAAPGVFLGFEVTEIYVVQLDLAQRGALPARKLKRAKRHASA